MLAAEDMLKPAALPFLERSVARPGIRLPLPAISSSLYDCALAVGADLNT